uniref:Putative conserved secreted protein midgut overexpressed n=1 Tax=Rhipicephalus microplus TaxID=6941 RepID=A0A6M2CFP6_RHIMP
MKTSLWVALLSLFAVAYGATLTPQVAAHRPVLIKGEADALQKSGKTLETLGRLLQGESVGLTDEEQEDFIKALQIASSNGEVLAEDGSEYVLPIIIRGVAQGVIAHVVQKKLNKG